MNKKELKAALDKAKIPYDKDATNKELKALLDGAESDNSSDKKLESKSEKVTFIKSPTGAFNMAYSAGDSGTVNGLQAKELREGGYIE